VELRPLGSTGMLVSPLGLGTVKFGRNEQVKYPRPFAIPDDRRVAELLALALDLGINLLDTAPAYGSSEARIGKLLPGPRDAMSLATINTTSAASMMRKMVMILLFISGGFNVDTDQGPGISKKEITVGDGQRGPGILAFHNL